ncbi:MAG: GEVED domain-containing protein, partial [Planctomycetota bacterium]
MDKGILLRTILISNVQAGDISNATDCNYYGDYTSMSTAMDVGTGYPITVTNGRPYDENDECGIWVDWNQDGDFNDVNEAISVVGSPGEGPYTATITPPPAAANGDTRLRIRIYAGPAGPCGEYDYGEVEDYTVTVAGGAMGQIHGRKFHDINGNGTQDGNEPGLGSWKIYIDANENGQWDSGELYNLTDVNGNYALVDLAAGSYTVAEVLQAEWEQTFPGGDGTHTVVLSPGELAEDINFGNRIPVAYGGGTGTTNDPYLIYTAEQMQAIGAAPNDWDNHFRLMADIDIGGYTGTSFNIIGNDSDPFTGVLDGNGHTISNLTYSSTGIDYVGLFGYVSDPNAMIKDVGLIDVNINAGTGFDVGSLAGVVLDSTISHCYCEGGSVSGNQAVGGLVGGCSGDVFHCYSTALVTGVNAAGGLAGATVKGETSNCYSSGDVSGNGDVGGLVGWNQRGEWIGGPGKISNCYAVGNVSGNSGVGGLVGDNRGSITKCYS